MADGGGEDENCVSDETSLYSLGLGVGGGLRKHLLFLLFGHFVLGEGNIHEDAKDL